MEQNNKHQVKIYTDGACSGNPDGPGGYGVVLIYKDSNGEIHRKELSAGFINTTNNRMEIMAAIAGLEALKKPCSVIITSDSQYLVNAINQKWVEKWKSSGWLRDKKKGIKAKNIDLWIRLLSAMEKHEVTFEWVKGHAGHEENEVCDKLAVSAAAGDNLKEDTRGKEEIKGNEQESFNV